MLRLGYNTSAFARHPDIFSVAEILASIGYAGMELSLDRRHFHPLFADVSTAEALGRHLHDLGLEVVIGTGARYVLSSIKHEPAMVSADLEAREHFIRFVTDTIRLAPVLGARVVMLHSGYQPRGIEPSRAWEWLVQGARVLAGEAEKAGIKLGLEFHPDMFLRTLGDYLRLAEVVDAPSLGLTLDVGHVACTEEEPISRVIASSAPHIVNVHLEDIKGRKHVHLPIGQGDIDFVDVFKGLEAIGYQGLINAEFNTDDLEVDEELLARQTYAHLKQRLPS